MTSLYHMKRIYMPYCTLPRSVPTFLHSRVLICLTCLHSVQQLFHVSLQSTTRLSSLCCTTRSHLAIDVVHELLSEAIETSVLHEHLIICTGFYLQMSVKHNSDSSTRLTHNFGAISAGRGLGLGVFVGWTQANPPTITGQSIRHILGLADPSWSTAAIPFPLLVPFHSVFCCFYRSFEDSQWWGSSQRVYTPL